jgi:hypothetical protein
VTVYAWPGWGVNAFELRVLPNLRTFVGPYTPTTQVIDLLGERWVARIDLAPTTDPIQIAAWEAFFDRLKGQLNQTSFGHMRLSSPQGTARGTLTLSAAAAQLANTVAITGAAAGATLLAGDMLGINGQLVRVMANATADGTGAFSSVEFQPRLRVAQSLGASVAWNAPTANFMLKTSDGVPTTWQPGMAQGPSLEFVEVW